MLDTGHHAPGTNIEFIVMQLLRVGRLGAFDFNSRNYADDDLIVGSADPFQLFRIMNQIVAADALGPQSRVSFMLDRARHQAEDPRTDPLGDERPEPRPRPCSSTVLLARSPAPATCSARTAR